jgi:hypothetical protein
MTTRAAPGTRALPGTVETDSYRRRLGDYHHGVQTKVAGVRLPVWKHDKVKAAADRSGRSVSEYLEWLIDTQLTRPRGGKRQINVQRS